MPTFRSNFQSYINGSWSSRHYVNYDKLKNVIQEKVEDEAMRKSASGNKSIVPLSSMELFSTRTTLEDKILHFRKKNSNRMKGDFEYVQDEEEEFTELFLQEIDRVDKFLFKKLRHLESQVDVLIDGLIEAYEENFAQRKKSSKPQISPQKGLNGTNISIALTPVEDNHIQARSAFQGDTSDRSLLYCPQTTGDSVLIFSEDPAVAGNKMQSDGQLDAGSLETDASQLARSAQGVPSPTSSSYHDLESNALIDCTNENTVCEAKSSIDIPALPVSMLDGIDDDDFLQLTETEKLTLEEHKQSLASMLEELESFENARKLNVLAAIKILKKHDNKLRAHNSAHESVYPELLKFEPCQRLIVEMRVDIEKLLDKVKACYRKVVCFDDPLRTEYKLAVRKNASKTHSVELIFFKVGFVACLIMWFLWECVIPPHVGYVFWKDPALNVYCFIGNLIAFKGLWGCEVYAWDRAHIAYIHLLEIHDKYAPNYDEILSEVCNEMIFFFLNLIFYIKSQVGFVKGHESPVKMGGLYFLFFLPPSFFPIALLAMAAAVRAQESFVLWHDHRSSHGIFAPAIMKDFMTAPFGHVGLKETFAGDFLTSMGRVLANAAMSSCYVFSGSVLRPPTHEVHQLNDFGVCHPNIMVKVKAMFFLVPLWLRLAQCCRMIYETCPKQKYSMFPHSYNFLKYFLSIMVTLISTIYPLNIKHGIRSVFVALALLLFTLYATYWDVVMDWGLMQILPSVSRKGIIWPAKNVFLRPTLMYHEHKYMYYFAIVADLLLRLMWTLSLMPPDTFQSTQFTPSLILFPFLALIEQIRRAMWSCFKMENEHIKASAGIVGHHMKNKTVDTAAVFDLSIGLAKHPDSAKNMRAASMHLGFALSACVVSLALLLGFVGHQH